MHTDTYSADNSCHLQQYKNKCGSGHRKLQVCVVKNPVCSYSFSLSSLLPLLLFLVLYVSCILYESLVHCYLITNLDFEIYFTDRPTDRQRQTQKLLLPEIKKLLGQRYLMSKSYHFFTSFSSSSSFYSYSCSSSSLSTSSSSLHLPPPSTHTSNTPISKSSIARSVDQGASSRLQSQYTQQIFLPIIVQN